MSENLAATNKIYCWTVTTKQTCGRAPKLIKGSNILPLKVGNTKFITIAHPNTKISDLNDEMLLLTKSLRCRTKKFDCHDFETLFDTVSLAAPMMPHYPPTLYGRLGELMFGLAKHVMRCDQIFGEQESSSRNEFLPRTKPISDLASTFHLLFSSGGQLLLYS